MRLPDFPFTVLDTETTGFVPGMHRVIEFASMRVEDATIVDRYEQLIAIPENDIPKTVQILTRISPDALTGKPLFAACLEDIRHHIGEDTVIIGQNVGFDIRMLKGEGIDLTDRPWIDTSMLASLVFPELPSYSLGYMSRALGLDHTPQHRAMGDVRATMELLSRCVERLMELPASLRDDLQSLAGRGPEGYRRFFAALPTSRVKATPLWLTPPMPQPSSAPPRTIDPPPLGTVQCQEEPIDPAYTEGVITGLGGRGWCAVKNLRTALRRHAPPRDVVILDAPTSLLSTASREAFLRQEAFTADELTLAMKLLLYTPTTDRDLPLHGDERAIWAGKLACTQTSEEYRSLLTRAANGAALVSHQQLLALALDPEGGLPEDLPIVIDDASMLEDTATTACAWTCHLPTLRGAAEGNPLLTQCVDLIDLWSEKMRHDTDLRYLTETDLADRVSRDLDRMLADVLAGPPLPPVVASAFLDVRRIVDPANLPGRIAWIETYGDRQKTIKSVPETVAPLLREHLFSRSRTTLLVPPGDPAWLRPIAEVRDVLPPPPAADALRIMLGERRSLEQYVMRGEGKTILLVGSKRIIEDVYVRHAVAAEEQGITLVCQGFSGGQGRMEAEFAGAEGAAVLVLTPWMYEGMEFPAESVHLLVLHTLPFDHPSHPVCSKRSNRYADGFQDYALPRLVHRLFRIVRSFARHAVPGGTCTVLDERLGTKAYGKLVATYLRDLGGDAA